MALMFFEKAKNNKLEFGKGKENNYEKNLYFFKHYHVKKLDIKFTYTIIFATIPVISLIALP
jgi:hypothetical protein